MNYSDFVNILGYGVNLIFNGIYTISNSLLSNYIFITLLGLTIFISIVSIVSDLLIIPISQKRNLDNVNDKKYKNKKYKKKSNLNDSLESTDVVSYPDIQKASVDEL